MLTGTVVKLLASLTYRADAKSEVNILPFGSVYWDDEMPDMKDLSDKPGDLFVIMSMFGLRLEIWDGKQLSTEDQQLWDEVQRQAPGWAFFHRLNLTDEQKLIRKEAEKQVQAEFESLSDDSDQNEDSKI